MYEIEEHIFACDCTGLNHVYRYWWDEETKSLYFAFSLNQSKNIFQRIWTAIGYIFNKPSRYGHYDEIIVNPKDAKILINFLKKYESL